MREFRAGDTYLRDGIALRIVVGKKQARKGQDLRLDIKTDGGQWVPIGMPHVAFCIKALYENEDRLYPIEQGLKGRKKLALYFKDVLTRGFTVSTRELDAERSRARERRAS